MFSLLIALVAIVLVAALAVAGVYYGGGLLSEGEAQARAATLVSQGEQIVSAAKLYYIDRGEPVKQLSDLVAEGYLTAIPAPPPGIQTARLDLSPISSAYAAAPDWTWDASTETLSLVRQVGESKICAEVNHLSFSVRGFRDAVDTRLRVQCYGGEAPYTVLWDAHATSDAPRVVATPGKHPLCQATENIHHIPGQCGEGMVDGAQLGTVPLALSSYPNAMGPIDWIPDLPTDYWENRDGKTCSKPQDYNTPLPAIQYVVTAPAPSALSLYFDEARQMITDDYNATYFYRRTYGTKIFVDGTQVGKLMANEGPTAQSWAGVFLTEGTHIIRLEFTATSEVGTDSYGTPYPPEVLPAVPPQTDVCISGLQMPLTVLPGVKAPATIPEPGHVRMDDVSCSVAQYPNTGEFWYVSAWYTPYWESSSSATNYGVTINRMTVVGTPETLDNFGAAVRADWRAGATVPAKTELWVNEYVAVGAHLVRTSPTTLSLITPITNLPGQLSRIRQFVCSTDPIPGGAYNKCFNALLGALDNPPLQTFDIELYLYGRFINDSRPTCTPSAQQLPRTPIASSVGGWWDWRDPYTGLTLTDGVPSPCGDGLAWDATRHQCVCQPSASNVCAGPNGALSAGMTNTNSGVMCTSTSCNSLPWAPVSAPVR